MHMTLGIDDNIDFAIAAFFGVVFGMFVSAIAVAICVSTLGTTFKVVETNNPNVVEIIKVVNNDFLQKHLLVIPLDSEFEVISVQE